MITLLLKERRSLRPAFIATTALTILSAMVFTGSDAPGIVMAAFSIGVALMAASAFGNEFQARTMMLLLTQPISRERIWREKMRELGIKLIISYLIFAPVLFVILSSKVKWQDSAAIALGMLFIPLCVFCSTPFFTLTTRNVFSAIAATIALPWFLVILPMALDWGASFLLHRPNLFLEIFSDQHPGLFWCLVAVAALTYCLLFYRFGRQTFLAFQVVDVQSQEIRLPAPVERVLSPWSLKFLPGFTSPFASLMRKELQLHRVSFILAGLALIIVPIAWLPWRIHLHEMMDNIMTTLMITPLAICVLGIPFLTGIVTVAEERNIGVLTWQMTQPISALKQWVIKISVAFLVCVILGVLIPAALVLAGLWLTTGSIQIHNESLYNPVDIAISVAGYVAWFSLLTYASTLSTNSIRAMLTGLGLLVGIVAVPALFDYLTGLSLPNEAGVILFGLLIVFLNYLSYTNFRAVEISSRRLYWQICGIALFLLIVIPVLKFVTFLYFTPG